EECVISHRQGKDPGRRRRIGLRQDHGRAPRGAPAPGDCRASAFRRKEPPGRRFEEIPALQAAHPDRVPEPVRLAQPALHGRPDPDRADADPRHRRRRHGAARPGGRAPRKGGPGRRFAREVPARVLGRPAPAHRHRPGPDPAPRAPDLRRSGVGARRLGPGAAIEPPAGSAGRILDELPLHLARPGGGALHGRRGDGDEGRRGRRDRRPGRAVRPPEASLYPASAFLHPRQGAVRVWIFLLGILFARGGLAAHAYAQFGDIKYPPGFKHFEWVNPDAPKGGHFVRTPGTRVTNFDKYNPFTIKGTTAPGVSELMFETLLTGTMDEPTTAYGLLAEDVEVSPDKLSATFRLNPAGRFQDGKPVMAADVKYSFERLMSKEATPQYRVVYADVKRVLVTAPRTIRFEFARASAELPLLVGGLPVFSRDWGAGKPFDQVIMDVPIASGPYRIGPMNFGRDITYERDPNYWARDLGVRRGMYNFDRVTYKIYRDYTAQTEAFKAGEFDYVRIFSAREWARVFTGKKFDSGELVKAELPTKNAGDFQSYWINTRREKFKD